MASFMCTSCGKVFSASNSLRRHERSHGGNQLKCSRCPKLFYRQDNLLDHLKTHERDQVCPLCHKVERSVAALGWHLRWHQAPQSSTSAPQDPVDRDVYTEKALSGGVRNHRYDLPEGETDFETSQASYKERLHKLLIRSVTKGPIKFYYASKIRFCKHDDPQDTIQQYFRSKFVITLQAHTLPDQLHDAFIQAQQHCAAFEKRGSGWVIDSVMTMELNIGQFKPLTGSSYIPLPQHIQAKKAVINIQNQDQLCFAYAVLAALHPASKNPQRAYHYEKYLNELNLTGLDFPLPLHQVGKFEKQNNISVNVLGHNGNHFYPLHTSILKTENQVDLLLITNDKTYHYTLIRSMSRLLGDLTKHNGSRFYCRYCLHRFSLERTLKEHKTLCEGHEKQAVQLPTDENKWLHFTKIQHQMPVPFTIFGDFESILVPVEAQPLNPSSTHTTVTNNHVACGYSLVVVKADGELYCPPITYRGENTVDHFVQTVLKLEEELTEILNTNVPLNMTPDNEKDFNLAKHCHICKTPLNGDSVRDHDHLNGKFRGAAHSACNLAYVVPQYIPVIFHNLRNYDSHLIMEGIGKAKDRKLTCIPNNMQKYISFSVGNLRFIDSIQFMPSSLDTLVNNLAKTGTDQFKVLKQHFTSDQLPLLVRKGIYPYEYFTGEEKFKEIILPPKEAFYSSLTMEHITDEEYEHANKIWAKFNMRTLGDYHDLYVLTDTLLLADVFQNFRKICMKVYNLDPCHYFTSPGLAWDACLKYTGVNLELLTDIDQYLFVEDGIRGGISMISTRYAKANNKYLENYDHMKPSSYLAYYDMNNLYGAAMALPLPVDGFRWMTEEEIVDFDINKVVTEGEIGYILSVDLEYPEELHDLHNDYPLAPERMTVTEDMLSPYIANLREVLDQKTSPVKKLVPNLNNKTNYVIHHRNLQQYLELGMKLIKINKVLTFRQSPWLKSYIDLNTKCRKNSQNAFEKDFFKLMNNAVYGKSMENLRNRVQIDLVNNEKTLNKRIASPACHAFKIFNEDLVGVHMKKASLLLNKPIYTGLVILDNSKSLMYDFHYNYIKKKYGDRAILIFTDTDSLTYLILTEDLYMDNLADIHLFDTSDYPKDHFLYSEKNKKVVGKMKDELAGVPGKECVGLRSKMYSIDVDRKEVGGVEVGVKKTAKGINRASVRKYIRHNDYVKCLFDRTCDRVEMTRIVNNKHKLSTVNMKKLGLSAADDKRYILDDGIHSLAYGHYQIGLYGETMDLS